MSVQNFDRKQLLLKFLKCNALKDAGLNLLWSKKTLFLIVSKESPGKVSKETRLETLCSPATK